MSTRDIYAELLWGESVTCTPSATARLEQRQDERFHDRMMALDSWLVAEIGRAELDRMIAEYHDEIGNTEFTGCPTAEEHSRWRTRSWTLLHELENRARLSCAIGRRGAEREGGRP